MPNVLHTITPLHLPPVVYQYVLSKVHADLPALTAPEPGAEGPVAASLLQALGLTRAAAGAQDGDDDRGAIKAPKTIMEA